MILLSDRRIADCLLRLKLWKFGRHGLFKTPSLFPCWATRWLYERMKRRQTRDGLHHAPMCHANEWDGAQLVVMPCNCGAAYMASGPRAKAGTAVPQASPGNPT